MAEGWWERHGRKMASPSRGNPELRLLVEIHNTIDPIALHTALQHLEDSVRDHNLSLRVFLELWKDEALKAERDMYQTPTGVGPV